MRVAIQDLTAAPEGTLVMTEDTELPVEAMEGTAETAAVEALTPTMVTTTRATKVTVTRDTDITTDGPVIAIATSTTAASLPA